MQENSPFSASDPASNAAGGADATPDSGMPPSLRAPSAETSHAAGAPVQLRQAREMAGLHVAMLASMLKVPVKKLEALEAGRYDQLPDLTFARALAQSVCRQLKIDPAPVLASLPQASETWRDTTDRTLSAPFVPAREMGKPSTSGEARQVSRPVVFAVLVLVAAAVLWWSLPGPGLNGTAARDGVTEQIMPPSLPGADTTPTVQAPATVVEAVPAAEPSGGSASAAEVDPAPAAPAPVSPAGAEETLRLTTTETTWVEVVGVNGQVLIQRNLQAGESVGLSAGPPLAVVVGRADVAEVSVRGQPFALAPHTRNNVARFEVR
jgi:cytoskeleton protein RodZ